MSGLEDTLDDLAVLIERVEQSQKTGPMRILSPTARLTMP